MSKMKGIRIAAVLLLAAPTAALADVWDTQSQNDNSTGTENELVHGSDQLHDLAPVAGQADLDYYQIGQRPYSSWEVIVDATSADIGTPTGGVLLQRVDSNGTSILQSAAPVTSTINFSQSLRWMNTTSGTVANQFVRVLSNSCTTNCNSDDVYRLRSMETTYAISRFNNVGAQVTVLILQNTAPYPISGNVYFWNASGGLEGTHPFSLAAKALLSLNTASSPGIDEKSGSITVSNTGRYGDLSGKTVAIDPDAGFAFDTLMTPRPN